MVNRGGVLLSELVELFKVIELIEDRLEKDSVGVSKFRNIFEIILWLWL